MKNDRQFQSMNQPLTYEAQYMYAFLNMHARDSGDDAAIHLRARSCLPHLSGKVKKWFTRLSN
jgi:hypothetical protein